jgi:hypothetical protein
MAASSIACKRRRFTRAVTPHAPARIQHWIHARRVVEFQLFFTALASPSPCRAIPISRSTPARARAARWRAEAGFEHSGKLCGLPGVEIAVGIEDFLPAKVRRDVAIGVALIFALRSGGKPELATVSARRAV